MTTTQPQVVLGWKHADRLFEYLMTLTKDERLPSNLRLEIVQEVKKIVTLAAAELSDD